MNHITKKVINWLMIAATLFAVFAMTFSASFAAQAFEPGDLPRPRPITPVNGCGAPECFCTSPECLEAQGMSARAVILISPDLAQLQSAFVSMTKKLSQEAALGGADAHKLKAIQLELGAQNEQILMLLNEL